SASRGLCQQRTASLLRVLIDSLSLSHARTIMDYLADGLNHRNWMLRLPNVPPHVDSDRSFSDGFMGVFECLLLGLQLRSSLHNERERTAFDHRRKPFTVTRLDQPSPYLRGPPS